MPAVISQFERQKDLDRQRQAIKKQRKNDIKMRKSTRNSLTKPTEPENESYLAKIAHLNGITAEGLAGEAIAELMLVLFQFIFNTPYLEQISQYQQAKNHDRQIALNEAQQLNQGLRFYEPNSNGLWPTVYRLNKEGKPMENQASVIPPQCATETELKANGFILRQIRMTYEPDSNGRYPDAYLANENGELDYTKLIENGQASPFQQLANGFVLKPDFIEGWKMVFDSCVERVRGHQQLSPLQKMRLHPAHVGNEGGNKNKADEGDMARDRAAMMAAQPRPAVKLPT